MRRMTQSLIAPSTRGSPPRRREPRVTERDWAPAFAGAHHLASSSQLPLDRVPDEARRVGAVEAVDRDDAGRRGDVDLGEPLSADNVDADEKEPARLELGAEGVADLALSRRQIGLRRLAADGEVGADLALAG